MLDQVDRADRGPRALVTYAVLLSGVIGMAYGALPTVLGLPALLVAVLIGTTLSLLRRATSAVLPSGVTAMSAG